MGCALCHAGVTVGARLGRYAGALAGGSRALLFVLSGRCPAPRACVPAVASRHEPPAAARSRSVRLRGGVRRAAAACARHPPRRLRRVRRGPSSD